MPLFVNFMIIKFWLKILWKTLPGVSPKNRKNCPVPTGLFSELYYL